MGQGYGRQRRRHRGTVRPTAGTVPCRRLARLIRSAALPPAESSSPAGSDTSRRPASADRWPPPRSQCWRRRRRAGTTLHLARAAAAAAAARPAAPPTASASEVMITISASTCARTLADRRALGAAQAELADALRHALPDHAGQAERRPSAAGSRRSCRRPSAGSCTGAACRRAWRRAAATSNDQSPATAMRALDQRLLERRRRARLAARTSMRSGSAAFGSAPSRRIRWNR